MMASWMDFDLSQYPSSESWQQLDESLSALEAEDPLLADIATAEINRVRGFGGGVDREKAKDIAEDYGISVKDVRAEKDRALQRLTELVNKTAAFSPAEWIPVAEGLEPVDSAKVASDESKTVEAGGGRLWRSSKRCPTCSSEARWAADGYAPTCLSCGLLEPDARVAGVVWEEDTETAGEADAFTVVDTPEGGRSVHLYQTEEGDYAWSAYDAEDEEDETEFGAGAGFMNEQDARRDAEDWARQQGVMGSRMGAVIDVMYDKRQKAAWRWHMKVSQPGFLSTVPLNAKSFEEALDKAGKVIGKNVEWSTGKNPWKQGEEANYARTEVPDEELGKIDPYTYIARRGKDSVGFVRWLADRGDIKTAQEAVEVLEKPFEWQAEREEFLATNDES